MGIFGEFLNKLRGKGKPAGPTGAESRLERLTRADRAREQERRETIKRDQDELADILQRDTFIPPTDAEQWAHSGDWRDVASSNVAAVRYNIDDDQLQIEYHDGSVYQYEPVSLGMACDIYNAASKGTWVWDHLRVRGTVFGYQVPYEFLSGVSRAQRKWMKTPTSRFRHGSIPSSGKGRTGHVITPDDLHKVRDAWHRIRPKGK